jgi:hypothetical protein
MSFHYDNSEEMFAIPTLHAVSWRCQTTTRWAIFGCNFCRLEKSASRHFRNDAATAGTPDDFLAN